MKKSTTILASLAVFVFSVVGAQGVNAAPETYDDRDDEYPGCATIIKKQLQLIPEAQRTSIMPFLFDACIAGRSIGEKRMQKMYEIPTTAQPKKKTGFTIEIVPPRSLKKDPFEVQY
mgnify:FL=1